MDASDHRSRRSAILPIAIAVAAGIVVLVLVFPAGGNAADPPTCYSAFGYVVPCEAWVAWAAAAAAAAVAGAVAWRITGRSSSG